MVTTRQKQGASVVAAALLLLGSAYAWQSANQHKTNELRDTFKDNDVTLVEDFVPITNWLQGQEVNKDISVKNNTSAETGNNAYVRIQLKEFLEFTDKTEERSDVRYAVNTEGNFAKFDTLEAAQAYANANNLTGNPIQITETAFEGENYWFIPTNAEATNGQYGKFLVLKVGDGTSKSIIDESVSKATNIDHQAITHAEDDYTTQFFNSGDDKLRTYPKLVTDYPTGGGIAADKDLKDYISWTFGPDVTTLDDFDAETATAAQWVIDPATGWVYWSQALTPGQTTGKFLDKLTLTLAPKNVSLYYAIHTDLEAVDYNDIDTMAPPTEIGTAWKNQKFTVTFDSKGGSEVAPVSVQRDSLITKPENPSKSGQDFVGWYAKADLTGSDWNFDTDKMPAANLTLYAKWEETPIARVHFKDITGATTVLPDQKIYAADPTLAIPAAPAKANHYFLGWAESASAAKTAMLYVPSTYTDVRLSLNGPDKTYLGYTVKPEHALTSIAADKTLYAVYYKQKDAVTTEGDEFIWANAIWRNLKTDMDTNVAGKQALVIKANALTEKEATGSGATTGYYNTKFLATQTTYFSSTGENGYDASDNNVRKANAYYYEHSLSAADKESVNKVELDNPNFADFKDGITLSGGSVYNDWEWEGTNPQNWCFDIRFKTAVDEEGTKQAFALSYGDINTTMGLLNYRGTPLLNFTGSNADCFWLRSSGHNFFNTCSVDVGDFYSEPVQYTESVRPALSIQIN